MIGHFFIKRVPGNFHISTHGKGIGTILFDKTLSAGHKINLLEFTTADGDLTLGSYSP